MKALYPRGMQHSLNSLRKTSPVSIAIERYKDAFLKSGSAVTTGQISSAIMVLETLLLREGGEQAEFAHRLGQRTAALMSFFGFHPVSVFDDVKESYEIRSKYVHGSMKLQATDEDVQRAKRALAYARNTLLLFLQCKILSEGEKGIFIDEIDTSLLEPNDSSRLSNKIPQWRWLCHPS